MNADDPVFDHSTFTKNRYRLLGHDIAGEFFAAVVAEARARGSSAASTSPWMAR